MNTTIDLKTAKTIDTMSKKIDHIDDAVTGFFSFMHMAMQNEFASTDVFFAAVSPVLDLTVIQPKEAPHILPCFDEDDAGYGISKEELKAAIPCGIGKIKIEEITKGIVPCLVAELVVLLLVTYIPALSTMLVG